MNKRLAMAIVALALLAGCGNTVKQQEEAGSFAVDHAITTPLASNEQKTFTEEASSSESEENVSVTANEETKLESNVADTSKSQATILPVEQKKEALPVQAEKKQPIETKKAVKQDVPVQKTTKAPLATPSSVPTKTPTKPQDKATKEVSSAPKKAKKDGISEILWSQFFDNEDQTTPSENFWDLSGSDVQINGYMGEVLSFESNWFLLIPKPGAECPFDNGDETYWNKIMIVFMPEGSKLRHHTGPLKITGRLDVGIKIDESGYKTMFRLYDASFEEIKE